MDKEKLITTLIAVAEGLNNVEVKRKQNLMNLYGCIALLDETVQTLRAEGVPESTE